MGAAFWPVAGDYLGLGIEHILLGFDHLLFVLCLPMIAPGVAMLLRTVTAFTLAHSLTLGLATLGLVALPPQPVEACIALSVFLLAADLVRTSRGHPSLTARAPWTVCSGLGLLHGFGFAGALHQIGVPHDQVAPALVFFNLGVEVGQLAVLVGVLMLSRLLGAVARRARFDVPRWAHAAPACAIGSIALVWVVQRTLVA
jgi:hypothetical protein